MQYYLFVFDSTHCAIAAQKLLAGLDVVVMPTLREISASCGMALRLPPEQMESAKKLVRGSDISGWRLYSVKSENKQNICELV